MYSLHIIVWSILSIAQVIIWGKSSVEMSLLSPSEQQMRLGKAQCAPSSASGSQVDLLSESSHFPIY